MRALCGAANGHASSSKRLVGVSTDGETRDQVQGDPRPGKPESDSGQRKECNRQSTQFVRMRWLSAFQFLKHDVSSRVLSSQRITVRAFIVAACCATSCIDNAFYARKHLPGEHGSASERTRHSCATFRVFVITRKRCGNCETRESIKPWFGFAVRVLEARRQFRRQKPKPKR